MKCKEIKTVSYVHTKDGGLVRFDELPPDVKKKAALKLMITYMNTLYRGKAVFFDGTEDEHETQKKDET